MKYNFLFCVHTFFFFLVLSFIILSPSLSPHCLSISSFFLHKPTDPSFFLRDPSPIYTSLAATDPSLSTHVQPSTWPISASILYFRRFSFVFQAVLVFQLCVSALCFGLARVSNLCFELGGFVFRAWVSVCGFDVWVTRFGFGGFRHLVVADFVAMGLFCGVLWVCWCLMVVVPHFFFFFCDWWFCLV